MDEKKTRDFTPGRNRFESEKVETIESGPTKKPDIDSEDNPGLFKYGEGFDPIEDGVREAEEEFEREQGGD